PASSQASAAPSRGRPAPSPIAAPPLNGTADARSACATSAALTRRPPPDCCTAERRQAARPATWGAAMLVPPFTSFSVSQRGTDEKATPGATRSGLASSPPRELHHPITSGAGGVPAWGGRAKAPGYDAPTDRARSADPGNPIVESPGPSFPALIVNTTPGCEVRKAVTMAP